MICAWAFISRLGLSVVAWILCHLFGEWSGEQRFHGPGLKVSTQPLNVFPPPALARRPWLALCLRGWGVLSSCGRSEGGTGYTEYLASLCNRLKSAYVHVLYNLGKINSLHIKKIHTDSSSTMKALI